MNKSKHKLPVYVMTSEVIAITGSYCLLFDIPIRASNIKCLNEISNSDKLDILLEFLNIFERELRSTIKPYIGTEFTAVNFEEVFGKSKEKIVELNSESINEEKKLKEDNWYILDSFSGTSEELAVIKEIRKTLDNLQDKYEKVYILRNEEVYKIYDFKEGRGFQPDFILFLKDRDEGKYYQVFIEPKGNHLIPRDEWKDIFLKEITNKYGENDVLKYDGEKYRLIGLPLYNSTESSKFDREYRKIWQLQV